MYRRQLANIEQRPRIDQREQLMKVVMKVDVQRNGILEIKFSPEGQTNMGNEKKYI